MHNVAEIKQAATSRWGEVMQSVGGIPSELLDGKHHPCPKCGGEDRFRVLDDFAETGAVFCNQCFNKANGDGIAAIRWLTGKSIPESLKAIAGVVGLNGTSKPQHKAKQRGKFVEAYDYQDERGELLFQVVRYGDPKGFSQRRPDGKGGWIWNLQGIRKVLYGLPEILSSTSIVWLCEGEKDCDRLRALGLTTTTVPGGAGKWLAEYAEFLRGRNVVILPDKDAAGIEGAHKIANAIQGIAESVKVLLLPDLSPKGDVSDWLDAGGTLEELYGLDDATPEWTPEDAPQPEPSESTEQQHTPSMVPMLFSELAAKHPYLREPLVSGLVRRGETMNVIAAPKIGKSWTTYGLLLSIIEGTDWLERFPCKQGRVLLVDYELHPETIVHRIEDVAEAMELQRKGSWQQSLEVLSLRGRSKDIFTLAMDLEQFEPEAFDLIIVDAVYRAWPMGVSESEVGAWTRLFNTLDRVNERLGTSTILVHHATKGNQSEKAITDMGSGSGGQSRAADTHLAFREHEASGCYVLEASLRSFAPVEPLAVRWCFPVWQPADEIDPDKLRGKITKGDQRQGQKDREGREAILNAVRNMPKEMVPTINQLSSLAGMGVGRGKRLIGLLQSDKCLEPYRVKVANNDTIAFRIIESK